jgi:uridine kinase
MALMDAPAPGEIARPVIERVQRIERDRSRRDQPVFVAIDGRSGSGKSTLSAAIADALDAAGSPAPTVTVIEGDLFYAGGSPTTWDTRPPTERSDRVIDWRRQRDVLRALRDDGVALWRPFDWESDDWDSDEVPLSGSPIRTVATPVVILEGAYGARPELGDQLDLRVLLDTPPTIRRRQLLAREGEGFRADWEERWSSAEDHYFGTVMTPERFDLWLRPVSSGHVRSTG